MSLLGLCPPNVLISLKLGDNLSAEKRKRIKEMKTKLKAPKEALVNVPEKKPGELNQAPFTFQEGQCPRQLWGSSYN